VATENEFIATEGTEDTEEKSEEMADFPTRCKVAVSTIA